MKQHPWHERFRSQLILALYRCGRQKDALQAFRDARAHLRDELGLDPGADLQGLEYAVLTHDPAIDAPNVPVRLVEDVPAMSEPQTSFIGRRIEVVALKHAVSAGRLTTVIGAGGVGKTRLVLAFARRFAERGEIQFIDLSQVPNGDAVAAAVANGLGACARTPADRWMTSSPEQRALERIGTRAVVLVLDNCEHVTTAAARSARDLLEGCALLRVVAISREPLSLESERLLPLGPLDEASATELFVERARVVQPLFACSRSSADHREIAELCRHLDGLPLAIELAAARTRVLPVPEIAMRLRDRFRLLRHTPSRHDGAPRHASLEAAIDWSYDMLFDAEQRMFRRMSVFRGGATIAAAERLCGDDAFELASPPRRPLAAHCRHISP